MGCRQEPKAFTYLEASSTGITFSNDISNTESLNILNYLYFYNGGGVASADFNRDGLADLYFTANQKQDELYLNKGDFHFELITEKSGLAQNNAWTTGVTTADIDGNGYPDLYICKVSPVSAEGTHNLLYLNQGPDQNGIPVFREAAEEYGLDFSGYSTQAAFFDQDLDGDLDMYLLNHSVHPSSNYGKGALRDIADSLSGDRFYRNHNGYYEDETSASGIHNGKTGYGLGMSIGDLNNDGYPDLYIGNDFFENDYLYLNNTDGTFTDIHENGDHLGHTSHFSMGNAITDINNDLLPDIVSVDMLPEDLSTYKTSGLEYPYHIYQNYLRNGYQPQYMQNTLHLNRGDNVYTETAYQSGIAASEWSWAPVSADFDNDTYRDLFITNGIPGATNDMDFVSFIANEEIQKKLGNNMGADELKFIDQLPSKKTSNMLFQNTGGNTFNQPIPWNEHPPSFSNGALAVDLDNDHDPDLVVNNINAPAYIIRNDIEEGNAITVQLEGSQKNTMAIGAKLILYPKDHTPVLQEYHPTTGYLSANASGIHLGMGHSTTADSLRIIWPDGSTKLLTQIPADTTLTLQWEYHNPNQAAYTLKVNSAPLLNSTVVDTGFKHRDQPTLEFNVNPLIPYASTNLGPRVAVGDLNGDNLEDLCFGGGKRQPASIRYQTPEGQFINTSPATFEEDTDAEGTDQLIIDANGDGLNDIVMVYGGNEYKSGRPLQPKLYLQTDKGFLEKKDAFEKLYVNASRVKAADYDSDGDLDLLIASDLVTHQYGATPLQYLLENNGKGQFTDITETKAPELRSLGNVTDIFWSDINRDDRLDIMAVGHWMPVSVLINTENGFELQENNGLDDSHGWWNTLQVTDLNNDGHPDLVVGNWGNNTRLTAKKDTPLRLYRKDMDDNGSIETVISYYYKGTETPFSSKDELSKQMPFLNKRFLSYTDFSTATMEDLFGRENLDNAEVKNVYELRSCVFINDGNGSFTKKLLPFEAQTSTVNDIAITDLNRDGFKDLILVGNLYEISTQLGRLDSNRGLVLLNDQEGNFQLAQIAGLSGAMKAIEPININGSPYWVVTRNNDTPLFLEPIKTTDDDPKK